MPEAQNERRNHNTTRGPNSTPLLGSALGTGQGWEEGQMVQPGSCLTHPGSDTKEDTVEAQAQADGREGKGRAPRSQSLSRWKHSEESQVLFILTWLLLSTVFCSFVAYC